jgi:thermitase
VKFPLRFTLLLLLIVGPGCGSAFARAMDLRVRLDGDRLTLHAKDQDLVTILRKLSDQGIRIRIDPQINPQITASFDNRPIGAAMSGMLKSVDYALIWRKDKSSRRSEPRLWEIRIFYKGQERRIQPLKRHANLAVVHKGGADYVKDILLLRLAPTMTEAALAVILDRLGATVIDSYAPLGIVRLRLPDGSDVPAVDAGIAGTPGVQTAEPDYAYSLDGGAPMPQGAPSAAPQPSDSPLAGATAVAVMDSGLLADYDNSPYIKGVYDAVSPGAEVGDALGHGTQMALIAAGAVNPLGVDADAVAGSPVVAIRAVDDHGFTSTYTMIRGIDYAIEQGARVLSLSWGTERPNSLLESATHYAAAKGLIVVAAAGNDPTGKPVYPAAYDDVIGVGALNPGGKKWDQSNFGDFVSVNAPGVADLPVGYQGDPGTYAGTSIATAYTARRIAAILDRHPDADRKSILRLLAH